MQHNPRLLALALVSACASPNATTPDPLIDGKSDGVDAEIVIRASSGPSLLGAFACGDIAGCELTAEIEIASTVGTFSENDGITLALHVYDESAGDVSEGLGELIEADTVPVTEGAQSVRLLRTPGVGEFAFIASAAGNWANDELAIVKVRASWTPLDGDLGVDCAEPHAAAIAESTDGFALSKVVASVDPAEGVHVVHTLRNEDQTWQLRHVYRHRTGELELIDDSIEPGTSPISRLEIGPSQVCAFPPCSVPIAYNVADGKQLRYAEFDGAAWTVETVGISDVVDLDIAVTSDGVPRIVDADRNDEKLHYAERTATGWQRVALEPTSKFSGDNIAVAIDQDDVIHVVHTPKTTGTEDALRYGRCQASCTDPASWQFADVFRVDGVFTPRFAFALDAAGTPNILHEDVANPNKIRHVVRQPDGSFVSKPLLDALGGSLFFEFDAEGTLHIVVNGIVGEDVELQHHTRRKGEPALETTAVEGAGFVRGIAVRRAMFWVLRQESFGADGSRLRLQPICQ